MLIKLFSQYRTLYLIISTILGIVGCYHILERKQLFSVIKGSRFYFMATQLDCKDLGQLFMATWFADIFFRMQYELITSKHLAQYILVTSIALAIIERIIVCKLLAKYKFSTIWFVCGCIFIAITLFFASFKIQAIRAHRPTLPENNENNS